MALATAAEMRTRFRIMRRDQSRILLARADAAATRYDAEVADLMSAIRSSRMIDEVAGVEDGLQQGRPGHRAPRAPEPHGG